MPELGLIFFSGMTGGKEGLVQKQIPQRGMTERKARATATATTEADSPKGNDRKKGNVNCKKQIPFRNDGKKSRGKNEEQKPKR
jgi:hypothetical protein